MTYSPAPFAMTNGCERDQCVKPETAFTAHERISENKMGRGLRSAPLLFRLRVKRGLLSQQFSDQFFGAINRDLIAYREQYFSIPLNLCVEFDALIAHRILLEPRNWAALIGRLIVKTTGRENCSLGDLEHFDRPGTGTSARGFARTASLRRMKLALQPAGGLFSPERIGAIAFEALKRARPFAARRQR
jgi:hypothetical protein